MTADAVWAIAAQVGAAIGALALILLGLGLMRRI